MANIAINDLQVEAINRAIESRGFVARRGRLNRDEIIVGKAANIVGCVTVKLAIDAGKEAWFIGTFKKTSPIDLSTCHDIGEQCLVAKSSYWNGMIAEVKRSLDLFVFQSALV